MNTKNEFIICFVLLALVGFCTIIICKTRCDSLGIESSRATKFSILNGCMIKTDKGFIPRDNWREGY